MDWYEQRVAAVLLNRSGQADWARAVWTSQEVPQ